MSGESGRLMNQGSKNRAGAGTNEYDPFVRGRLPVGVRTIEAHDTTRDCLFPCEVWYPAAAEFAGQDVAPGTQDFFTVSSGSTRQGQWAVRDAAALRGTYPLVIFSHPSGGHRRTATFLCTHLSSHGYVVAAMDHSEAVIAKFARKSIESDEQKAARWEAVIANRVPDIRFLLDHLLSDGVWESEAGLDAARIGIVGHSLGGWTALAATALDSRIRAVAALAPGGSSQPKPGILPVKLTFNRGRDVPTLYLVAENDASLPLDGMYEIFERTPVRKQMAILRRADHMHFMDNVEEMHEIVRAMSFPTELAWLPKEMRPIAELCSGKEAHLFVRGLTLCHMDSVLTRRAEARRFLAGDVEAELAVRGVDVIMHKP
ncbi:MAG TPA: dienelactone hydrolase family protein [Pyrinomonadaceae bacterium]|nr:dienelactone hydrolase family protein [Pyrinomonadaceae bacterium]